MTGTSKTWDVVVIGSGFGGSMTALRLAEAGLRVLILERGRWAMRDASAWDASEIIVRKRYASKSEFEANDRRPRRRVRANELVGGNSITYGGASFRLRASDFEPLRWTWDDGSPGSAEWPYRYEDLAPFYDEAERLIGIAGIAGADPTEPRRAAPYPYSPPPFNHPARRVEKAARALGLNPFPLPLAINYGADPNRASCVQCTTCDLFPCKVGAKNDLAVTVLPAAVRRGAVIRDRAVAERLIRDGDRVRGVACIDQSTGNRFTVRCDHCIVSGGAIGSAALLLRSGLAGLEPHGRLIGRYLMRHCSGVVAGLHPFPTNPDQRFHKQIAITDFYHGHPSGKRPDGPWGVIQALQVPPPEMMAAEGPFPVNVFGPYFRKYLLILLVIAEDVPSASNRVELNPDDTDPLGLPRARVFHHYCRRDTNARTALMREAKRILRKTGSLGRVVSAIDTYSHAIGTCRMGTDPAHAVLDPWCRVFGVRNLSVVDGSFFPRSGGVNPSLTIAANALRVGDHLRDNWDTLQRADARSRPDVVSGNGGHPPTSRASSPLAPEPESTG